MRCDCRICNHPFRSHIENALFKITEDTATEIVERISKKFALDVDEIHDHMLFHSPTSDGDSIVRQIKLKEADILQAAVMDQLNTMQDVGSRIRRFVNSEDPEDIRFEKTLTKPVVDLYIGSGDNLRRGIQTLAEINQLLNGPKDTAANGMLALAEAIRGSAST